MKNLFAMLFLCISITSQLSCQTKKSSQTNNQQLTMQNLDSLLNNYTTKPVYYAEFGNRGCFFEIWINGTLMYKHTEKGTIGKTAITINPYILLSGKQTMKIRLFPYPDEETITEENPFRLEIGYNDFAIAPSPDQQRPWNVAYTLPEIKVPEGGLPHFEVKAEFDAKVPYLIKSWIDCIDLREIPNIEKKVVAEYEYVRELMINQELYKLKEYLAFRDNELSVSLYESKEDCERKWRSYCRDISGTTIEGFQAIEDYELIFSENGRSVMLRSIKEGGFPSALLWIKYDKDNTNEYDYIFFNLCLGIRKGTDKLIAIVG